MKWGLWKVACVLVACGAMAGMAASSQAAKYLGPGSVAASPDGKTLYVANEDANQIAVVTPDGKTTKTITVPAKPTGLAVCPDGKLLVTCIGTKSPVCLIDAATGKIEATITAGHTARGPAISPDGKKAYVCNQFDNDISVIDLEGKKEVARVAANREPMSAAVTPDGKTVFVSNLLPIDRADAYDVAAEITAIDTASNATTNIRLPNGSSSVIGVCTSPDGKYAYAVHILARYQMPTTQLERGWMNTNAISVIDAAEKKLVNTVLLDDVDLGAANPWGVACTADSALICVTHAGTHELSVIDAPALIEKLLGMPAEKEDGKYDDRGIYSSATAADVPNDLAFLVGLRRRIRLDGKGPRGLAIIGDKAYAAEYFSDTLAVIDLTPSPAKRSTSVPLGPKPELTVQRQGELFFQDASLCFQHWQSCVSCHPGSRTDGLNWDLMNDGMGNPKNVRSMLLSHRTPPSMSSGIRPTAEVAVRSGITHIQFAVRPESDAVAIDEYLKALKPVPSPALENGKLSAAAERGKKIFFSKEINCAKCHPEPLYTDLLMHDVGSKGQYDRRDDFDSPTLIECWRTAPYMHDGRYTTLKELFTVGKHGKKGGPVDKLSAQEIDDLVEFVRSL